MGRKGGSVPSMIAACDSLSNVLAYFPEKEEFDKSSRQFILTFNNQTPFIFVLEEADTRYGYIEVVWQELGPGTRDQSCALRVRGYKSAIDARGITSTFHLCILNSACEDTGYRLNIFVQIGHLLANNYFGWYICSNTETPITPKEWFENSKFNRRKKDAADPVLNKAGTYPLSSTFPELQLHIDMQIDNFSCSMPIMNIRDLQSK